MQACRKIATANHDHEKAKQMMSGFGYSFVDGPNIRRRGSRNSLRMGVPVADKMQPSPVHLVDLPLFFASVGQVQISRPPIRRPWSRNV